MVIKKQNPIYFYQWDKNINVEVKYNSKDEQMANEIHFWNENQKNALVYKLKEGETIAPIPNILLQSDKTLHVYAVYSTNEKEKTLYSTTFSVENRPKPDDYVYTEEEIKNYDTKIPMPVKSKVGQVISVKSVDEFGRIIETETVNISTTGGSITDEQIQEAVGNYFDENPIQGGVDGKDGLDGKSAYVYAQEGGYVGSEEEFAEKLANEYVTQELFDKFEGSKVDLPKDSEGNALIGNSGQFLISNGDGTTSWLTVINGNEVAY